MNDIVQKHNIMHLIMDSSKLPLGQFQTLMFIALIISHTENSSQSIIDKVRKPNQTDRIVKTIV